MAIPEFFNFEQILAWREYWKPNIKIRHGKLGKLNTKSCTYKFNTYRLQFASSIARISIRSCFHMCIHQSARICCERIREDLKSQEQQYQVKSRQISFHCLCSSLVALFVEETRRVPKSREPHYRQRHERFFPFGSQLSLSKLCLVAALTNEYTNKCSEQRHE